MDILRVNHIWQNALLMREKLYQIKTKIFDFGSSHSCSVCGNKLIDNERLICNGCNATMPRTSYHRWKDNPMERPELYAFETIYENNVERYYPQNRVDRATAFFFYFNDGKYKHLITNLKYGGKRHLGTALGKWAAQEFIEAEEFRHFDYIIPVPLHIKRKLKRGYNQSDWIALGISEIIGAPILFNIVRRNHNNSQQALKDALQRRQIDKHLFSIKYPKLLEGKKLLLVDDVFTTGTTINTLAKTIKDQCNAEIFAFTLGKA